MKPVAVHNDYPELPEVPFKRTSVPMATVIDCLNKITEYDREVRIMALCIFRNESANGRKGVNNNYAGVQADCGRWYGLEGAIGTCVRIDSGGVARRFICFPDTPEFTLRLLCFKVKQRGLYAGSPDVKTIEDFTKSYLEHWVSRPDPTPTINEVAYWRSLYLAANKVIK